MNILKCFGAWTLIFLSILIFLAASVNACSCMPRHPQSHFCDADYVIVMRVLRKSTQLVRNHVAYKIEIKKSYKMTEEAQNILKHGRITTSMSENMCGVSMEVGKLYVVASKGPRLSLCNYIKEYQQMSIIERRGFGGTYRKGCKCKINFCVGGCSNRNGQSCNWSPFAKCETNYSSCVPSVHSTPEGPITKCYWKRTPPYKACLADP